MEYRSNTARKPGTKTVGNPANTASARGDNSAASGSRSIAGELDLGTSSYRRNVPVLQQSISASRYQPIRPNNGPIRGFGRVPGPNSPGSVSFRGGHRTPFQPQSHVCICLKYIPSIANLWRSSDTQPLMLPHQVNTREYSLDIA